MDDDVMPTDGTFLGGVPREPKEQVLERQKEKAKTLEALTAIQEVIIHFDERIEALGRLDSIANVSIVTDPADFQKAFLVNRLLIEALTEERQLLEEKLELYAPNR